MNNNKGMSLVELIVAAGIGMILSSVAAFVFIQAVTVFQRQVRAYEAEAEMFAAMYAIKATFAQSINLDYGGVAGAGNNNFTLRGQPADQTTNGRLFEADFSNNISGNIFLISLGLREMGVGDAQSRLHAYGVYFQAPEANTSGALYVDIERDDTATPGGFARVSPVNAPLTFGRMTEFGVENIRVLDNDFSIKPAVSPGDIGKRVVSAEFRLAMRYNTGRTEQEWRWCPSAMIAGNGACQSNANFFDVEKRVKVVFTNNAYERANTLPERAFGNIYFFKGFAPTVRQ